MWAYSSQLSICARTFGAKALGRNTPLISTIHANCKTEDNWILRTLRGRSTFFFLEGGGSASESRVVPTWLSLPVCLAPLLGTMHIAFKDCGSGYPDNTPMSTPAQTAYFAAVILSTRDSQCPVLTFEFLHRAWTSKIWALHYSQMPLQPS